MTIISTPSFELRRSNFAWEILRRIPAYINTYYSSLRNPGQAHFDFRNGPKAWGYPSKLTPSMVVSRARSEIGKRWKLFTDNCQHFATDCHEDKHSPQLQWVIGCTAVIFVLFYVMKR